MKISFFDFCNEISGITSNLIQGKIEKYKLSDDKNSLLSLGLSSPDLKDLLKTQVFEKTKKFNILKNTLTNLVDKDIIIPIIFSNNDDFIHLLNHFKIFEYEKRIMGFFEPEKNQIFLLLNNLSLGPTGSISNTDIFSLVIHELIHYSMKNLTSSFISIFNDYLFSFYKKLFCNLFSIENIPDDLITNYLNGLYILETKFEDKLMFEYLNKILAFAISKMDKEKANIFLKLFKTLFNLLSKEPDNETGNKLIEISSKFLEQPFYKSYKETFFEMNPNLKNYFNSNKNENKRKFSLKSIFYQEFLASSEVIAILAGTLVIELSALQMSLNENNPIAKMIIKLG